MSAPGGTATGEERGLCDAACLVDTAAGECKKTGASATPFAGTAQRTSAQFYGQRSVVASHSYETIFDGDSEFV